METSEDNQSRGNGTIHDEEDLEVSRSEIGAEITLSDLCEEFFISLHGFLVNRQTTDARRVGNCLAEILSLFLMPQEEEEKGPSCYVVRYHIETPERARLGETKTTIVSAYTPKEAVEMVKKNVNETLSRRIKLEDVFSAENVTELIEG